MAAILGHPSDQHVSFGEEVYLNCISDGHYLDEAEWYANGNKLDLAQDWGSDDGPGLITELVGLPHSNRLYVNYRLHLPRVEATAVYRCKIRSHNNLSVRTVSRNATIQVHRSETATTPESPTNTLMTIPPLVTVPPNTPEPAASSSPSLEPLSYLPYMAIVVVMCRPPLRVSPVFM